MSTKTDVVIIGAGVGGMCAGALLAKHGYQVTVCDRLHTVGGRSRTQVIDGYRLPRGAVSYQLKGVLPKICEEVGAVFDVRPVSSMWFWIKGGGEFVELPARSGIGKMLEMFMKVQGGNTAHAMTQVGLQMSIAKIGAAFRNKDEAPDGGEGPTFREWLLKYTDHEELLSLFHTITSAVSAVNDFEYPARHWFTHFSSAAVDARIDKYGLVAEGFEAVSQALRVVIEANGGEMLLNTSTVKIETAGGRATGVVVERDGTSETISADIVISNAGPIATLALAGDGAFDPAYLTKTRKRVQPTPIVVSYTVSDQPLFTPRASLLAAGLQRIVSAVPLTNICPEWAPDGKHLTAFYGTPKSCLKPMDKDDERRANTEDIFTLFPDFEACGGRILDVQLRDIDDPDVVARSWPGHNVPVQTSIPNLFNVGDACAPDGFIATPAAAMSARMAVDHILSGARR